MPDIEYRALLGLAAPVEGGHVDVDMKGQWVVQLKAGPGPYRLRSAGRRRRAMTASAAAGSSWATIQFMTWTEATVP